MVELASSSSKPLDTEVLLNPLNDRCVSESEIPLMPNKRLSLDRLYPLKANGQRKKRPDPELIKNYQYAQGQLSKEAFISVVKKGAYFLQRESNMIRVDGDVVIFGDIHGQYFDLLEVMRRQKFGKTHKKFLFLGDYVDRGDHGPEVVAYLFALKARYPN